MFCYKMCALASEQGWLRHCFFHMLGFDILALHILINFLALILHGLQTEEAIEEGLREKHGDKFIFILVKMRVKSSRLVTNHCL